MKWPYFRCYSNNKKTFFSLFNLHSWNRDIVSCREDSKLNKILNFLSPDPTFSLCRDLIYLICLICQINCDMINFCSVSSCPLFLSSLNLDYTATNFFFPLYSRVSKSIIHSNKQSTLYTLNMPTLNEDLLLACGREDLSRRSRYVSGDGRGKSNWFLSQFPSLRMSVLFLPTDPTLLPVIICCVRLTAN